MSKPTPDVVIEQLRGPHDRFREIITDKDKLLEQVCNYAEFMAGQKHCEPWSIIGQITGHGSGISNAIYELYRKR